MNIVLRTTIIIDIYFKMLRKNIHYVTFKSYYITIIIRQLVFVDIMSIIVRFLKFSLSK